MKLGGYPAQEKIHINYDELVGQLVASIKFKIEKELSVPGALVESQSCRAMCDIGLEEALWQRHWERKIPCFFVGNASL